jgi:hypothetical protein
MLWGHFTVRAAFWRQLLAAGHKPSAAARAREPARVGAWRGSLSGCECAVKTVVLNDIVKLTGERVGFVIYQVKVLHGLVGRVKFARDAMRPVKSTLTGTQVRL